MAKRRTASVSVHNLDRLPDEYLSEDGERREDRRKRRLSMKHEMRNVVHFQPVRQNADALSVTVGVRDDDDAVIPCYQVLRQVVNMELHPSRLGVEEVRHQGNVIVFPLSTLAVIHASSGPSPSS